MQGASHIIATLLTLVARFWLVLTLLLATVICLLTLWPADRLYDVGGSDKFYHLVAYLSVSFPVAYMRPPHWKWVALLLAGMGGVIELIQPYVTRSREFSDFVANSTGVLLGIAIAALFRYWWPINLNNAHKKTDP